MRERSRSLDHYRAEMDRKLIDPSARYLVTGIVMLVLGQVGWDVGRQQALVGALYGDGGGEALTAIGAIVSLIGLVVFIVGIWNLATSVDYLAQRAKERDGKRAVERQAPARPPLRFEDDDEDED